MQIEQIDRDAAANLMERMPFGGMVGSVSVRSGESDNHMFVQAFAAHRNAAHDYSGRSGAQSGNSQTAARFGGTGFERR